MAKHPRIVSLISSATEIVYLLGLGDRLLAVSHECDFPTEVNAKPHVTRSLVESAATSLAIDRQVRQLSAAESALYAIDVEALAALAPDLILTQAQCDVCAVRYEDVEAAVRDTPALHAARILALNPHSLADVFEDIRRIAAAASAEQAGEAVLARLEARVRRVRQYSAQLPAARPRVACLEWIDPPMLAANWTPELVHDAGGQCSVSPDGRHSTYADWGAIVDYDPQVVVIMPCGFDLARTIEEAQVLPCKPGWSSLSAVRERRVFAVDGNAYFNRSGPRLVDSMEILAHLFYAERFVSPIRDAQGAFCRVETRGDALIPEIL